MLLAGTGPSLMAAATAAVASAIVALALASVVASYRRVGRIVNVLIDGALFVPIPVVMLILGADPRADRLTPAVFGLIFGALTGASSGAIVLRSQALPLMQVRICRSRPDSRCQPTTDHLPPSDSFFDPPGRRICRARSRGCHHHPGFSGVARLLGLEERLGHPDLLGDDWSRTAVEHHHRRRTRDLALDAWVLLAGDGAAKSCRDAAFIDSELGPEWVSWSIFCWVILRRPLAGGRPSVASHSEEVTGLEGLPTRWTVRSLRRLDHK